jgi:excisionase family DNA binding protein
MDDVLTVQKVAELCAVSSSTIQYWERKGYLKSYRTLGGHRRFRKDEVLAFLEKRGLSLSPHKADEPLFTHFKTDRRKEPRWQIGCSAEVELFDEVSNNTLATAQGRITDISNCGFGLVLEDPSDLPTLVSLLKKVHILRVRTKNGEGGFFKNPLIGSIRNIRQSGDQVRIGLNLV